MAFRSTSQKDVAQEPVAEADAAAGTALGSFVGYLRRPKSSAAGLTAQVFGENGSDADVIAALHLTRFLDANVKVTVWMMKDSSGRVTRKDGGHVKLTEFIATIRRPMPSNSGQVAQFFGENGINADAINILNRSEFLDALVYIEMHQAAAGMTAADIGTPDPSEALAEHSQRLTPGEAREAKKLQKRSEEALQILKISGFFRNASVLDAIGRGAAFAEWLEGQNCCHPGDRPCDGQGVCGYAIPGGDKRRMIPLCAAHRQLWQDGEAIMPDGSSALAFGQAEAVAGVQRWAMQAMREQMKTGAGRIPTPGSIYAWASDRGVAGFIPAAFKSFLA